MPHTMPHPPLVSMSCLYSLQQLDIVVDFNIVHNLALLILLPAILLLALILSALLVIVLGEVV